MRAFLEESTDTILGQLTNQTQFAVDIDQRNAWLAVIACLRGALADRSGTVFLEFSVPRLGSRIDAVLVEGPAILPIEFKCGASEYLRPDLEQAWDYALDLKYFHEASHRAPIFPILVATEAARSDTRWRPVHADGVRPPARCNGVGLGPLIEWALLQAEGEWIDGPSWGTARYLPTPTIIEAARALYTRHTVDAITRNDAGARNLSETSAAVEEVIEVAKRDGEKAIVFVTGVPGAGKTLVGLNVATRRGKSGDPTHAVYLSGNGPLVAVLREALTRDEWDRVRGKPGAPRKGEIKNKVQAFIQNVHHFRDDGLRLGSEPPADHVAIFDEAQRAWDLHQTASFMRRRKGVLDFAQSESEFLLSVLDRHQDWAVVVCLVGEGQEIHTGEAGISAWLDAVATHFPRWHVYLSPELAQRDAAAARLLSGKSGVHVVSARETLHLRTSMRSFRAESLSQFVNALLEQELEHARSLMGTLGSRYPLAVTRDLTNAKSWLRRHARGSERYGLLASSQAQRLKPYAIDVRVSVDPVHYFLDPSEDTRSSYFLEDAATEFQIQGLELDWTCVTWDADLRVSGNDWAYHSFRGRRWENVHKPARRRYLLNAYRVLLTRARQGMVIFVPPGDRADPTRPPEAYDETYAFLRQAGIEEV